MLCLSIDQVWWLNEQWFKRYIQKCTMSHVLMSQICYVMRCLKIQKLEYHENGIELFYETKFFLRSFRLKAEISFKYRNHRWDLKNLQNSVPLGTSRIQLACMKVQTHSFLKPPLEYNQDQALGESRLVVTFLTSLRVTEICSFRLVLEEVE